MREPLQRAEQFVDRRPVQNQPAHGTLAPIGFAGGWDAQFHGLVRLVESPGMIDLGEVVVLGSQPEQRHRRDPPGAQCAGSVHRRQGFVNRVRRARKQPDLLAGNDSHGSRLGQQIERLTGPVLGRQRLNQSRAAIVGIIQLVRGRGKRIAGVRIVPVESRHPVEMIGEVGKQRGSAREVGMADTSRFHVELDGANGPRLTDVSRPAKVAANSSLC